MDCQYKVCNFETIYLLSTFMIFIFYLNFNLHYLILGGQVLEVCLAKWWANIGAVKVSYTVTFFGITPSSKEIMFHGSDGITRIDLKSSLHLEEAQPEAKLKYSVCI